MGISRMVAGVVTVVTTVLGLSVVTAGGATAAGGAWRAYGNTNPITSSDSRWSCGPTRGVTANRDVVAQVCAVRSANLWGVQAAVIVRNNRSSLFSASAVNYLYNEDYDSLGSWQCASSGIAANSWSVCFGSTLTYGNFVKAQGYVNNMDLYFSPFN